jgi:hypothetical protein
MEMFFILCSELNFELVKFTTLKKDKELFNLQFHSATSLRSRCNREKQSFAQKGEGFDWSEPAAAGFRSGSLKRMVSFAFTHLTNAPKGADSQHTFRAVFTNFNHPYFC